MLAAERWAAGDTRTGIAPPFLHDDDNDDDQDDWTTMEKILVQIIVAAECHSSRADVIQTLKMTGA